MLQGASKIVGSCGKQRDTEVLPDSCVDCMARHMSVCAGLDTKHLNDFTTHLTRRTVKASQALFNQGDDADDVFTLPSGTLKEYKLLADGRC
ncbi:MAG: cyclic nucleotide-binding domain-containing protein [Rhodospirillaceae bacterium]